MAGMVVNSLRHVIMYSGYNWALPAEMVTDIMSTWSDLTRVHYGHNMLLVTPTFRSYSLCVFGKIIYFVLLCSASKFNDTVEITLCIFSRRYIDSYSQSFILPSTGSRWI